MADGRGFSDLVVVGASAGGIEALSTLVSTLSVDFPAPIVIAQHLDPSRVSHLEEILAHHSTLPVRTVRDHAYLEAGVVFVVPANRHVELSEHDLKLREVGESSGPSSSIDLLLESAARVYGEGLIGVILTGSGSDGMVGARAVKGAGGTVVIQNPETARFPSMPSSLPPTIVDVVANIDAMGQLLHELVTRAHLPAPPSEDHELRDLLERIRGLSGIDFNSYKATTIMRRLQRRMVACGAQNLHEYIEILERQPDEYQRLINSFLIKVTEFFRDADLFQYLREQVIPDLIRTAEQRNNELRVWSAGCATGEEAYSLAILVCEALGSQREEFNVRIFATDLDASAVAIARRGVYPALALASAPPDLVERYFNRVGNDYEVAKRVRSLIIFGQHDLGQRAPFPRLDLTLCRNVLIYFTPELQKRALQLFAFSLRDDGYLVLGKGETPSPLAEYFAAESLPLRVYRRRGERMRTIPPARWLEAQPTMRPRTLAQRSLVPLQGVSSTSEPRASGSSPLGTSGRLEALLLRMPIGVVVADRRYDIQFINNAARRLFEIPGNAIGEDLIHLVRGLPSNELRAMIDSAFRSGETTIVEEITALDPATAAPRSLRLTCMPNTADSPTGPVQSVMITITDVSDRVEQRHTFAEAEAQRGEDLARLTQRVHELAEANRELLEANQEIDEANLQLRSSNEDYFVGNEEIQAAAEEVETLNEELQATNEELETINEELQATVEELNAANEDLRARSLELQDLATRLELERHESESERERLASVLVSMGDAVRMVDRDGKAVMTNAAYETLFGGDSARFDPRDEQGNPLPQSEWPQQRAMRGETFTMKFTLATPDGVYRWFEANGQPSRSNGGGGVVVIRDITDRSLRDLAEQFLAMTSHEL